MAKEDNWKQNTLTPHILDETSPSYSAVIDLQHAIKNDKNYNILNSATL